jgi:chromate transport protein ChrA
MTEPRTTWGLVRYFLYLGSLGFGGPAVLVGYIQRDLVESRGWFRVPEPLLIIAAGLIGIAVFWLRGTV